MPKRKNTVKMVRPKPAPASRDSTPVSNIEVEDTLGGICRLCLTCDGIFTSVIDNRNEAVKNWILNCLSIQVDTNDTLPKTICHRCLFFLEISQEFVELLSKKLKNPNYTNCFVCTKEADKNLTLGAPIVSRKLQSCIAQFQMKNQQKNSNRLCKTCYCKLDYLNDLKKKACESKLFFSETEVNTYIQTNTKSNILPAGKNEITKKLLNVKNIVKATRIKINKQIKADTKMFYSISSVVLPDIIKLNNLIPETSNSLDKSDVVNKRDLKRKAQDASNGIWQVASSSVPNTEQKRSKRITQKSVKKEEEKLSPVMKLKKLKTNDDIKVNKRHIRQKKDQTHAVISIDDSSDYENNISIKPRSAGRNAQKLLTEKAPVADDINITTRKRKTVTNVTAPKSKLRDISKKTREPKSQKIKIRMFEAFPSPIKKSKVVDLTPYSCKYCNESFPSTCDGKAHELNNHSKFLKIELNPVDVNENANENESNECVEKVSSTIEKCMDSNKVLLSKENHTSEVPQLEKSIEVKETKISSSIDKELAESEEICISGELRLSVDDEHDDIDDDNTKDLIEIKDPITEVDLTITDSQDVEDCNLLEETVTISEQGGSTKEIEIDVHHTEDSSNTTVINQLNQTVDGETDNGDILHQSTENANVGNSEFHESKEESNELEESQNTDISNSVTDIDETKKSKKDSEKEEHYINLKMNSDEVFDEQQETATMVSDDSVVESEANAPKNIECVEETHLEEDEKNVGNDVVEEEQIIIEENIDEDVNGSESIGTKLDIVEQQFANEEIEVATNEVIQEIEVATDGYKEQSDNNGEYSIENQEPAVHNEEASVDNDEATVDNDEATVDNEEAIVDNEEISVDNEEATVDNEKATVDNEEATVDNEEATVDNEEDTVDNEEATVDNEESTVDNEEAFVDNEEATVDNEEVSADEETSPEIEVTVDNEDASANNEEASVDNEAVSVENENLKEKEDVTTIMELKDENKSEIGDVENSGQKNAKPSNVYDKSLEDLIADLEN